jgi:hypothetical protein
MGVNKPFKSRIKERIEAFRIKAEDTVRTERQQIASWITETWNLRVFLSFIKVSPKLRKGNLVL